MSHTKATVVFWVVQLRGKLKCAELEISEEYNKIGSITGKNALVKQKFHQIGIDRS